MTKQQKSKYVAPLALLASASAFACSDVGMPGDQQNFDQISQGLAIDVGEWDAPTCWPLVAVHVIHLHTGKILAWPNKPVNGADFLETWVWDPKPECFGDQSFPDPNCFRAVNNNETNLFCAGHAALADGQIITTGGHHPEFGNLNGLTDANLFDPDTEVWSGEDDGLDQMDFSRWYPTSTTLGDGRVLTVSGSQRLCRGGTRNGEDCHANFECPGEFTPGVPASCESFEIIDIPEIFDPEVATTPNGFFQLPGAQLAMPLYPNMHLLPDGRVFYAGAEGWDPSSGISALDNRVLDIATQTWTFVDTSTVPGSSSVSYEPGKILKVGGTHFGSAFASAGAQIIDLTSSGSALWQTVPDMAAERMFSNLTLLPDGTVMASGGTRVANREYDFVCEGTFQECSPPNFPPGRPGLSCPASAVGDTCAPGVACVGSGTQYWVSEVEIFDPDTNTWTAMAPMATPRQYHSATILLPDGRVVSSGGGQGSGGIHNYATREIFSPPYLFKGARPTVTAAPAAVDYAQNFDVTTPDAADIAKATLIRLGVTTHGFDQNTRLVPLTFQAEAGGVEITGARVGGVQVPISPNVAPPGYYLLFLVNNAGVPAIGRYIRIGDGPLAQCQDRTVNTDAGTCSASDVSVDDGSFDPGGSAVTLTQSPPGPYPLGATDVTLTATDGASRSDTCVGTVTVEDHEPPAFSSVPGDITTTLCGSFNIGTATVEDACAGAVSVSNNAPAAFPPGTTVVTWTAIDASGNTATATQRVTVLLGDNPACCPAGTNVIIGSPNNDTLNGSNGSDCILGRGAQDTINGSGGNDFIAGGDGNDIINAGSGNDAVFAGSGQDTVDGAANNDVLYGGDGNDTLRGGSGDDELHGGQGQDSVQGQDNNDRLFGDDGDDNLQGGNGNDDLVGGINNDTCNDGSGSNTFAQCEFGAPNSCNDGVGNGTETDTDCGGACPDCGIGDSCVSGNDCENGIFCVDGQCGDSSTPNLIQTEISFSTDWGGGYCAVLNVTNNATVPTTSFTALIDTHQSTIYTSWNGNFSAASGLVNVTPAFSWNSAIDPDETDSTIGFCANRTVPGSGTLPVVLETTASY